MMTPAQKRSTIKEVAQAAGVSIQTVSRVINDHPDVAQATRQNILRVIAELDYRPSALARGLIQQRTCTLGIVTAGLKYIGPSFTLNGIISKAESKGYAIFLEELPGFHVNQVSQRLDTLLARQVDGILWAVPEIGDNRDWLEQEPLTLPVPIVFLTMQARSGVACVSFDNYWGGRMATQHLLDAGYRAIGHISGPSDWWEARQRKAGWQSALEEAGVAVSELHWAEGNWSAASGESAFRQLLTQYPQIDAVFVANDQMAFSVLQSAWKMGIRVPDGLGVVGFDGLPESAFLLPPLTTIYQDLNSLGSLAIECLVEAIDDQKNPEPAGVRQSLMLRPELVVRESSHRRVDLKVTDRMGNS